MHPFRPPKPRRISELRPGARHRSAGADAAFSLVEIVIAAAIAAAVITTAVMIYQNITAAARPTASYSSLPVGATVLENLYGLSQTNLDVYSAPNYGRRADADLLRDKFWDDVARASAVFCLGRDGRNPSRPTTIAVPANFDGRTVGSPEAFRQLLPDAGEYDAYRGASAATNASIFLLQPSASVVELSVRVIYDIDLVPIGSDGTYAAVTRHEAGVLTDYYDIFYPAVDGATVAFNPLVVAFERAARKNFVEGDAIDRLKIARGRPFYFVWWPDPAVPRLEAVPAATTYAATDPKASYPAMGGRTSFFFVVPMFPAL